jgi:hypothetical protein
MTKRTCLTLAAALWMALMLLAAPSPVYASSPSPTVDENPVGIALQNSQVITSTQPVTETGQTAEGEDTSQEEQDTVPPSDLTQALGTLGIFAAVMAVLAVGTEVMVDTIKLAIGMKSKPTAIASMEKLEALLPGKLKEFGASADAQKQVEGYLKGLRVVMEDVQTIQESILDLRKGQVLKALRKLHDLTPQEIKEQLKGGSEAATRHALDFLTQQGIELTPDEKAHIGRLVTGLIIDLNADSLEALEQDLEIRLNRLIEEIHTMADDVWQYESLIDSVQSAVESWLNKEGNKKLLAEGGANALIQKAEESLLQQLPLPDALKQQVSTWLKSTISSLDITAQTDLNNYLGSLANLLQAVNDQRYQVQSPARKLWRRLRRIQFGGIGKLFERIERAWNWLLGRAPEHGRLDKPREMLPTLTLTNAAQVVLEQETHQRDEEASRLRWLRVVSVFAGIWLASYLQINAGELLSAKVIPGELVTKLGQTVGQVSGINLSIGVWPLNAIVGFIKNLELGYILSGLGAAAGSAFWHDQLEKLQSAKKASEQLDRLRAQLSEMQGGETQ